MEEEDYIIATWAQEDVQTLYNLLNNNMLLLNFSSFQFPSRREGLVHYIDNMFETLSVYLILAAVF